jgi:hypothetical protein
VQLPGWAEHRQTAGEVDPSGSVGSVLPAFALRERERGQRKAERKKREGEKERRREKRERKSERV